MFGCRRNLAVPVAAVLMLALTTPAGGLAQPVPSTHVFRELHVGLAALAANLGIPVAPRARCAGGPGRRQLARVAPGDVTVTEDQAPMMRLSTFPVVRGGVLYVNASDVSSLLDVYAIERNGRLQVSKHPASGGRFRFRSEGIAHAHPPADCAAPARASRVRVPKRARGTAHRRSRKLRSQRPGEFALFPRLARRRHAGASRNDLCQRVCGIAHDVRRNGDAWPRS